MNYTSAQANKLLKKLNDEYTALLDKETRSRDFRAAMGEDVESVRPVYDYAETQIRLAELEARIRKLKHAINIFNATQTVDSFDMTIDELLVYIPQLTKRNVRPFLIQSRSLRVFSVQRQKIGYFGGYPLCGLCLWFTGNIYRQHR